MKAILVCSILLLSSYVYACDICGCSIGGQYFGILPNYQKHFLGIRYQYSHFRSIHPDDNKQLEDYYHNTELWGRFTLNKRLQFLGILPFRNNKRNEGSETYKVNGIGDASLLSNFIVFNNSESSTNWKKVVQVGAGIKFPTGSFNVIRNFQTLPVNFQLGSGSIDALVNSIVTLRYKKQGINIDANYRINTVNPNNYSFGNRLGISTRFFYWYSKKKVQFLPHIGLDFENTELDFSRNKPVEYTGGTSLLGNIGFDIFFKNTTIGLNIQNPISQTLNQGLTTSDFRPTIQLIQLFKN
jgi:hypothetical protein